jgi:hypothetical protein
LPQEKRRNYDNPEEKVQAETFLKLILIYKYPAKRIRQFVPVQMGSETKEADIIVYADDETTQTPLQSDQHVDYLFHRLFSLIWMLVEMRQKN